MWNGLSLAGFFCVFAAWLGAANAVSRRAAPSSAPRSHRVGAVRAMAAS